MSSTLGLPLPEPRREEARNLPVGWVEGEKGSPLTDIDEQILARARLGSEEAWRSIYRDIGPAILRYLRARRVPDPDDVLGEVFIRIVRNLESFSGTYREFRAWSFSIVRNMVIDLARRGQRRPEDPVPTEVMLDRAGDQDTSADALRTMDAAEVQALLSALTDDQREVILLRFFGQLSSEEAAQAMGKKVGAVKTLQRRALAALKREISKKGVSR